MSAMHQNLIEAFNSLNRSRINYVALQGYVKLPADTPSQVEILTDNLPGLVQLVGLHKIEGCRYALHEDLTTEFILRAKGFGYFPERFETGLLQSKVLHNETVYIPGNHLHATATLYLMLFRDGWLKGSENAPASHQDQERRKILIEYVTERVGPPLPCRLPSVDIVK